MLGKVASWFASAKKSSTKTSSQPLGTDSHPFLDTYLDFFNAISIDFKITSLEIDGKKIKLQIWDTAGQERFRTITTAYYKGASGILLMYDVTREESFQHIGYWMESIGKHAATGVVVCLIGNKCDMQEQKVWALAVFPFCSYM